MATRQSAINQWSDEETAVGTTLKSVSPNIAEVLGHTPLDFLFIDRQHGSPIAQQFEHVARASDLNGMPIVVRVPKDDLSMVTYHLDIGARAIMIPQVEDSSYVEEALQHVHYQQGRSVVTTSRTADFGYHDRDEYISFVNEKLTLLPQIESLEGVDVLDEIVAMDEITDIAIGPGDLAFSMGVESGSQEHRNVIDQIYNIAESHGCNVGMFVGSESGLERYSGRSSFVIYSSDVGILSNEVERILE
jgi:2-keto-3-deoxy-L-rhamnonate aldolase RhmA